MSTIIISEKKKAAEAIAEALGSFNPIKLSKSLTIFHISSKNVYIIPLRGHILEYRNTDAFKSWKNSNPREIILNPNAIKKYPIKYSKPYINALKAYAKKANHCIIGTDADVEGCNIGLMDALPFIKESNENIKVSQLWLSSLQKTEIKTKFNSLIKPRYHWAKTGEARAIIDAFIGFSATRQVTNTFEPILHKFNVKFTSIGRVQTSLLYLLYLRDEEIKNFIPESYFTIIAYLIHSKGLIKATHEKNPFIKELEDKAKEIYDDIKNEKLAYILENEKKIRYKFPPTPLNTSKALILLTRTLKISADVALKTMNSLYLNKIITYPRTDSDVYKQNFDHKTLLHKFQSHNQYGKYVKKLIYSKRLIPTKGRKDVGDHPPITPLESLKASSARLENTTQRRVYDILSRHYLALFGEKAKESVQKLQISIKNEIFTAQIVCLVSEGFYEITPFLKQKYQDLIEIQGRTIPIKNIEFNKKLTNPPPLYSDTSILKLMEKHGLGTKSTRPKIIRLLTYRKSIKRNKGRYMITELGSFIIKNLIPVWLPFLKPEFTKSVEENLEEIKNQKRTMNQVIGDVRNRFLNLFDKFLANRDEITSNIKNYKVINTKLNKNYKKPDLTSSMCIKCGARPMKFVNLRNKRFLVCSDKDCKTYLSLPKNGNLKLLKSTCSICGFNIFKINLRKNKKLFTYYLCPACWNQGLKDKTGKGFCSNCENFKIVSNKCIKR